uniref:Uncharacterized protein n=1 Tax=Arundo donax TaxID=35708 RepID=A0A0A8YVV1_ARUDO
MSALVDWQTKPGNSSVINCMMLNIQISMN